MDGVRKRLTQGLLAAALMSSAVVAADAQLIFQTIKQVPTSFDPDPSLGAYPAGNLIEGREGALYGTMSSNGVPAGANGTLFRVNKDGSGYTLLWRFTNAPGMYRARKNGIGSGLLLASP